MEKYFCGMIINKAVCMVFIVFNCLRFIDMLNVLLEVFVLDPMFCLLASTKHDSLVQACSISRRFLAVSNN